MLVYVGAAIWIGALHHAPFGSHPVLGPSHRARTTSCRIGDGVPPIEELAARQHAAALLRDNWATVSERLGGVFAGDDVKVATSSLDAVGLVAQRDIAAGEMIALHPVDRVLQVLKDGQIAGAFLDQDDAAFFRPTEGTITDEERAYRQVAYRQTYSHVNPQRPEAFLLDANPQKDDAHGWMAHRINDGATLSPGASEDDLFEYYKASGRARNCCAVSLCVPLLGFVTTKPVAEGEEILATYGHAYWLQTDMYEAGERATELSKAVAAVAREADLWQVATDKKHSKHIAALEEFISTSAAAAADEASSSSAASASGGDAAEGSPSATGKKKKGSGPARRSKSFARRSPPSGFGTAGLGAGGRKKASPPAKPRSGDTKLGLLDQMLEAPYLPVLDQLVRAEGWEALCYPQGGGAPLLDVGVRFCLANAGGDVAQMPAGEVELIMERPQLRTDGGAWQVLEMADDGVTPALVRWQLTTSETGVCARDGASLVPPGTTLYFTMRLVRAGGGGLSLQEGRVWSVQPPHPTGEDEDESLPSAAIGTFTAAPIPLMANN
jgi:hypothetical protein